jgi:hypothetical protein
MHIHVLLDDNAPQSSTAWVRDDAGVTWVGVNGRMPDDQIASEAGRTVAEVVRRYRHGEQ